MLHALLLCRVSVGTSDDGRLERHWEVFVLHGSDAIRRGWAPRMERIVGVDERRVAAEACGIPRVLADLADGRLDDADTEAVLAWLQTAGALKPPAPWLVNRAVRIGRQPVGSRRGRPTLWRRVVATLLRDTRLEARATGARALGPQPTRLLYQAGRVEVDLEVTHSEHPGRRRIVGQVTADEVDLGRSWAVADGPGGRAEADLDALGQFMLDGLAAGSYSVEVGLVSALIDLGEVQL